ncbi:NnrU family protein [Methylocapsa palsarum]|uniref:NnrU protein n=1 Tax=Methylocapsa palsarum TaxID=1612308 RepID=A0A1I4A8K1_9HYPH|nr:NnrU family protein [Methylocapsa palsarum]SFK52752.1 NnrU protein [Methylocapsa palsarum]
MLVLILGIAVFLGVHVLSTFRDTRADLIKRFGAAVFRIGYSAAAIAGFVLIVWGFSRYRAEGLIHVWSPPLWTRHLTIMLMWFAFIALACMNPAPGRIRGWLRHPMLVAIKIWALAHLLVNGDLGGMILFGSFLAFAVYDRIAVKKRGDLGAPRITSFTRADAIALGAGTLAYLAMIALHPVLIGAPVLT